MPRLASSLILRSASWLLLCTAALPAQDPAATALDAWLGPYLRGDTRLAKMGQVKPAQVQKLKGLLDACQQAATRPCAQALLRVASAEPKYPGGGQPWERDNFGGEVRVQQVRALACRALVMMDADFLDEMLLGLAQVKPGDSEVELRRSAAIRVLVQRDAPKAREALLRASRSFRPEIRVRAVRAMTRARELALVPLFFDLLRDREVFVRIAALDGIGKGLAEHVDETRNAEVPEATARLRDRALKEMGKALQKDKVWQVRAAALEAMVGMRCKAVIPELIAGLKAEMRRKREPWGMEQRILRALEGLTGQKIAGGSLKLWEEFWKQEGPTFKFRDADPAKAEAQKNNRYDKFFDIQLESNRVLFIVDLSDSMKEEITLKPRGTAAASADRKTTKVALVVEELKKMALSLRDGDMFNIIVFGTDVRPWKTDKDGRPALVKMNDDRRDELLGSYLNNLQTRGMTNLHGALKLALDMGGRGLYDKYYGLGYDTIYLLSDGAPTAGEVTDPDQILRQVRESNALRRLKIHTITFGEINALRFLKTLAAENGGKHVHVE